MKRCGPEAHIPTCEMNGALTLSAVLFALSFKAWSPAIRVSTELTKSFDNLVNQSQFLFVRDSGRRPDAAEAGEAGKVTGEVGEEGEVDGDSSWYLGSNKLFAWFKNDLRTSSC